jgi:hypothetical protein
VIIQREFYICKLNYRNKLLQPAPACPTDTVIQAVVSEHSATSGRGYRCKIQYGVMYRLLNP